MSIKIFKGNAPLMDFSFAKESGTEVVIPADSSKYVVKVHDSAGVRSGAGTIGNINTSAGTCQYQAAAADTANAGVVTWWVDVDIGEPVSRTFEPQKFNVFDPALV